MSRGSVAPAFTRRHYVAVADAIEGVREGLDEDGACRFGIEAAADALAALFAEDNERFDCRRFLAACGIEQVVR